MAPNTEIADLKSHLGFWMRFVSNHVSKSFALKLKRCGVTVAEWVVLRELYPGEEGTAHGALSARTGFTKGAISKLLAKLEEKKLVTLKTPPLDRRGQHVSLTSQGRLKVPRLASLADTNDAEYFSHLTASEKQQLLATLKKLVEKNKLKTIPVD